MGKKIIRRKKRGDDEILVLMRRRHYQIIVHSFIYYELDDNLIDDHVYDAWSKEMAELVRKYPERLDSLEHGYEFRDFDGSSGFNLNYMKSRVVSKALQLLLASGRPLSDKTLNYLDRKSRKNYDKSIKQEEEISCHQKHQSKKHLPRKLQSKKHPSKKRPLLRKSKLQK